jgi:hypothetical protein
VENKLVDRLAFFTEKGASLSDTWSELMFSDFCTGVDEEDQERGHLVFEAERPPSCIPLAKVLVRVVKLGNPTSFSLAAAITKAVQPWALAPRSFAWHRYHRFIPSTKLRSNRRIASITTTMRALRGATFLSGSARQEPATTACATTARSTTGKVARNKRKQHKKARLGLPRYFLLGWLQHDMHDQQKGEQG